MKTHRHSSTVMHVKQNDSDLISQTKPSTMIKQILKHVDVSKIVTLGVELEKVREEEHTKRMQIMAEYHIEREKLFNEREERLQKQNTELSEWKNSLNYVRDIGQNACKSDSIEQLKLSLDALVRLHSKSVDD